MKKFYIFLWIVFIAIFSNKTNAQISITQLGVAYTQDFNTLANSGTTNAWTDNSTIAGWYTNRTVYIADDGTNTTGGLHSYGSTGDNERALGTITSGSAPTVYIGARVVNNTGSSISSFNFAYKGEQWRQNTNGQTLVFEYQVGATNLTDGTWTPVTALDFTALKTGTAAALDGNAAGNYTNLSSIITVTVTNGQEIWFRWTKTGTSSPGLAIDDVSITANGGASIPVSSITVTGDGGATTITTNGGTLQMHADILPVNATNQTVTWSVINGTGQATISPSGLLTAVANGTVTVRATANDGSGVYGELVVTISNQIEIILVTSINVTGEGGATTITTNGGTLQLYAEVLPVNATNQTVTWSVINGTGQATISASGLITAVANGIVTARATANDGSGVYGTLEITISNQVSTAAFYDGFTGTGNIGGDCSTVGSTPDCTNNGWFTHSGTVGTIDIVANSLTYPGLVNSTGNKIIILGNNSTLSRDVNAPFTVSGDVAYYSAIINIIDNTQLTTNFDYFMNLATNSGNTSVTIFGARLGIKSVNSGSNFRLGICNMSGGTTTYTEVPQDLDFGTNYFVVVKMDKSTSPTTAYLWVNPSSLGTVEPAGSVSNNSGTGSFSNFGSICIRNSTGTPKAYIDEIRVGNDWASVTPLGTMVYVTSITVTGAGGATTITTNGGTLQMHADILPVNATNQTVTWSVINGTGQATISPSGLLTAVANGTVTVRATANDGSGVYGELVVTISNQIETILVSSINVTGEGGATTITTNGGTLQLYAEVLPVNATNQTVTWSVINVTGQASINASGLLTAIANGTVTARATANDGSGVFGELNVDISNQTVLTELLYEPFNYPVGDSLPQHGWIGVNTGDQILVTSNSLFYTGLQASIGNKVSFVGAGRDFSKGFTSQNQGTVYYSFIMQVTDLTSMVDTSGYFIGFISGNYTSSTFGGTVWVAKQGTGFKIGVNTKTTISNTVWSTQIFNINEPILIVTSYEFVSGGSNDIVKMWINPLPSELGTVNAPTADYSSTNSTTDLSTIDRIFLRQDSNLETPAIDVDEIRVGTTWASVTPPGTLIPVTSITVTGEGGATTITTNGGTLQMYANVQPSDATNQTVTWSVINGTGQATISPTGLLTAIANGTVTVRATANDGSGVFGELVITISNQIEIILVQSIIVTGENGATTIEDPDGTLQMFAEVLPNNATNQTVTWSVINGTGQATISPTGLLTAIANGTVTVRATANDGSGVFGELVVTISNQIENIAVDAMYTFADVTNTTGTTDPTPVPVLTGMVFGSFSAVNVSNNSTASGRFSFTNWELDPSTGSLTGSINTDKYYQVTLTPNVTNVLDLDTLSFTLQRSGTGVRSCAVRSSLDGYTNNLPALIFPANNELTVVGSNEIQWVNDGVTTAQNGANIIFPAAFDNITSAVTFRFYGWNAEGTGGTFSIDNVNFVGSLSIGTKANYTSLPYDIITYYPNPTTGIVNFEVISADEYQISVINSLGSMVVKRSTFENNTKIDLSGKPSGLYFIVVTNLKTGKQNTYKIHVQ